MTQGATMQKVQQVSELETIFRLAERLPCGRSMADVNSPDERNRSRTSTTTEDISLDSATTNLFLARTTHPPNLTRLLLLIVQRLANPFLFVADHDNSTDHQEGSLIRLAGQTLPSGSFSQ
jgi:hypothetical protein